MEIKDLSSENVVDVYDQKSHPTPRQIHRGKLTWQNYDQMRRLLIRISPVQFSVLYGPSPLIQPFLFFSHINFGQVDGPSPTIKPSHFWAVAFLAR
jgi:hypothetical protein